MYQVAEMSHKEKVEMYRMVDKEKLIEMLIECNNQLNRLTPVVVLPSTCNCTKPWSVSSVCVICEKPIKLF